MTYVAEFFHKFSSEGELARAAVKADIQTRRPLAPAVWRSLPRS